ncbi:hypothetical protein BJY52DRAFT_1212747 [Lactarius psammicola]|nr:hypothetical protein BJY52DRAFT_1212747 [Lactarius psammicola]
MIQGEVRIWKRGTTDSPLELTEWTDVLDQALHYPDVDWLIRTETSPNEAIAIEVTWKSCTPVPHVPFERAAPLSSDSLEPSSLAFQMAPFDSSDSAMASNVVHSQSRKGTKDMPERQRQVVAPVPRLASPRAATHLISQMRLIPMQLDARSPLRKQRRSPEVTDSRGFDLENCLTSVPTSRRSLEGTCLRPPTVPPLVQIAYHPLERFALSIEDLITSTSGTLTPDANETLASWPTLERCLIKADIPTDPLAVLAATARDSGCRTSS